ncbi:MAG: hypothetical protein TEF_09385 [Rhizobiales bacterium NRL2]|jgi:uncharacterized protein (UPF0262 family)|nr:MAG: hypothetical protein TEF_09385 [Rhizobiales bacterium NRL2]
MASPDGIAAITLDDKSIKSWGPDVDHERKVAIFDLIEENSFAPLGEEFHGPFAVHLKIEDNRLAIEIAGEDGTAQGRVVLALSPFRRIVRDYFKICESYFAAIKTATPSRIESIDMGRRGVHNEGSELLQERLKDKIEIDFDTARRLFTLICVLHIRT